MHVVAIGKDGAAARHHFVQRPRHPHLESLHCPAKRDHVGSLDDHVDVVALHGEFDEPIAELFASGGECALQCTEASMRAQIPDFAAHANGDV